MRTTFDAAILSGLFSLISSSGFAISNTIEISCQDATQRQFAAIRLVGTALETECTRQNDDLEARGFPSCGNFCTEKFMRTVESGRATVSVDVTGRQSTSGSSASMSSSGMGSGSFGGYGMSSMGGGDYVQISVALKLDIPLGPTDVLTCVNPLFTPFTQQLAARVFSDPQIVFMVVDACS